MTCNLSTVKYKVTTLGDEDDFQSIYDVHFLIREWPLRFEAKVRDKCWAQTVVIFSWFLSTAVKHRVHFLHTTKFTISIRAPISKKPFSLYNLLNVCHREYFLINIHLSNPLLPALSVFKLWICLTVTQYVLHSPSNSSSTTTPSITTEHFCRAQINYKPACQAIKSIITQSLHLVLLQ